MKSQAEIIEIVNTARALGVQDVEIDGVKYNLAVPTMTPFSHTQVHTTGYIAPVGPPPELKAEEMVKPLSVLDEYSDDEILYYSSPYYDELQAKKEAQQQLKKESDELKEAANG